MKRSTNIVSVPTNTIQLCVEVIIAGKQSDVIFGHLMKIDLIWSN